MSGFKNENPGSDTLQIDKSAAKFVWNSHLHLASSAEEMHLSHQIFGDDRVISLLKKAFEFGLGRNLAWDVSRLSSELRRSAELAARVYKRGVAVAGHQVPTLDRAMNHTVDFVDNLSRCFSAMIVFDVTIVDENVAKYWWPKLPQDCIAVDFSEQTKNVGALARVMALIRLRARAGSRIQVVGGGVAGDVVGFAAGLLQMRCRYIPTTLLSMVDSSIGGKVGVNFEPWGKNQLGLFHAPESVTIWPGWLTSLPEDEIKSGLAEALKHAILSGNKLIWQKLLSIADRSAWDELSQYLPQIVDYKRQVVNRDPFEISERAVLNFGHTLGHALETFAHQRGMTVTHGECVAVGMFHELRLSEALLGSRLSAYRTELRASSVIPNYDRLKKIFGDVNDLNECRENFLRILADDKKSSNKEMIPFVLLKDFGAVARAKDGSWTIDMPIREAWLEILETWRILCS